MPYEIEALAGKPYEPSNGDEGRRFMAQFCAYCIREDRDNEVYCDLATAAMVGDAPTEWTHDYRGRPKCTAYRPRTWDDERRAQSSDIAKEDRT